MVVGTRQGDNYIKAGQIVLAMNETGTSGSYESAAYINADHVNISATDTVHTLAGDISHDADGKLVIRNAAGLYVERDNVILGVWDSGNLTGSIMVRRINQFSTITIQADKIDINGLVTALTAYDVTVSTLTTTNTASFGGEVEMPGLTITDGGDINGFTNITGDNAEFDSLTINGSEASWKSQNVVTSISVTADAHRFALCDTSLNVTSSYYSTMVHAVTANDTTIHYLGY
jgi:hypothetical protein